MAVGRREVGGMRPALLVACAIYTVFAFGSAMDRFSLERPAKAARVPWPFADQALVVRGQTNMDTGQFAAAMVDGERAVRAAPIDPASTTLLGDARRSSGDAAGADKAFRVAGQMGWRIPQTQAYWMQQALALGDYPIAAMRLDAMLRQYPSMMEDGTLLAPFEDTPQGREALSDRLDAKSPWLSTYAGAVEGLSEQRLQGRANMLVSLARKGVVAGCDAVAPAINRLTQTSRAGLARELWAQHCPDAKGTLLVDARFEHLRPSGARTYFDWEMVGSSDVSLVPISENSRRAIEVSSSATSPRPILRQLVAAPSGTYRLSWRESRGGKAPARVVATFACTPELAPPIPAIPGLPANSTVQIGNDCPAHWLIFFLLPGEGEVHLSDIALQPVR